MIIRVALAWKAALFIVSVIIGGLSALQNVINSRAAQQLGNLSVLGAELSFSCGLACVTVLVCAEVLILHFDTQSKALRSAPLADLDVEVDTADLAQLDSIIPSTAIAGSEAAAKCVSLSASSSLARSSNLGKASLGAPQRFLLCWKQQPSWYMLAPGVLGAVVVTTSVLVTPLIGHALYSVAVVLGQITSAAALDMCGLPLTGVEIKKVPFSIWIAASLLVVVVGASLSVSERLSASHAQRNDEATASVFVDTACFILSAIVASLLPVQAALNRSASAYLPSKLQALWWSFFVGAASLAIVTTVYISVAVPRSVAALLPSNFISADWWMFLGGPIGCVFVGSAMLLVAAQGASTTYVAFIAGQLIFAAVIDSAGLLGATLRAVTPVQGVGIALTALGAVLVQFAKERATRATTGPPAGTGAGT